jgi:RNA polymerase sigma-70 factor, ECF subfamily
VYCYRLLGSFDDAEDQVQETYLRAWKKRATFEGRSTFRAWLYRIATNACLDFLERNPQRTLSSDQPASASAPPPHIPWLQPFPDRMLEPVAPRQSEPDALVVARENIELAFLVAIQFLPARQRAALILCDVLDWSAKEAAELLDSTVAAVNGALQRARATMRARTLARRPAWPAGLNAGEEEKLLLQRYVAATEANDLRALALLMRTDLRSSMPPNPFTCAGLKPSLDAWIEGGFGSESLGEFRCVLTRANHLPAVACYLRAPGESAFKPLALDVLEIEDGKIVEITTFPLELICQEFALPSAL